MVARATDKPTVAATPEPRREKVAVIPVPQAKPAKAESFQVASAGSVPVKLAGHDVATAPAAPIRAESVKVAQVLPVRAETDQPAQVRSVPAAADRSNSSANNVINDRGYWQGLPSADSADAGQTSVSRSTPAARRATEKVATASVAPWPIDDRTKDRAPCVGALGYAPQALRRCADTAVVSRQQSRRRGQPESRFAAARADELAIRRRWSARDRTSCRSATASTIPGCAR